MCVHACVCACVSFVMLSACLLNVCCADSSEYHEMLGDGPLRCEYGNHIVAQRFEYLLFNKLRCNLYCLIQQRSDMPVDG